MVAKKNPITWESPNLHREPIAWTLTNKLLAGAGGAISLLLMAVATLVILGFQAQDLKNKESTKALCDEISEVKQQHKEESKIANAILLKLVEDVAILKTNQAARLDRERKARP